MDKELIKKYKTEFDHWLNGGKVISKYTLIPTWSDCQSEDIWRIPDENISKVLIVINDEYVIYRKALAEGKAIQHVSNTTKEWIDFNKGFEPTPSYTFLATPEYYRIKPEEPKFKAGDWVVHPEAEHPWRITQNSIDHLDNTKLKLWKPKPGEWYWVFNDKAHIPVLRRFVSVNNTEAYPYKVESEHSKDTVFSYRYIEPIIGELPSSINIKD